MISVVIKVDDVIYKERLKGDIYLKRLLYKIIYKEVVSTGLTGTPAFFTNSLTD
jgi:hypothetical protein